MLNDDGRENGENKSMGLISNKNNFARAAYFLYISFARLRRETRRETRFIEELYVFLVALFFYYR